MFPSIPTIAVLGGTGDHGRGLAFRLALGGCRVLVGSRDLERARRAAAAISAMLPDGVQRLTGLTNLDAAAAAGIALLTMPWQPDGSAISGLRVPLAGKTVVSCANPIGFDARGPHEVDTGFGSAAEHAANLLPDSRVAGAFHHLSARTLIDPAGDLAGDDVLVCGDDEATRHEVCGLCVVITGRSGIDAGPLRLARQIESFTAVLISVNRRYRTRTGVGLRHVPETDLRALPRPA